MSPAGRSEPGCAGGGLRAAASTGVPSSRAFPLRAPTMSAHPGFA